ncbi:MAG: TylF/MycF/NovP-related O-methyltransferase [Planctomycetota bacterium]|nr:TylF/MycF/NovP-related O-methyltransferase [Planctomycetota bacterium]
MITLFKKIKKLFRKKKSETRDRRTELKQAFPDFPDSTLDILIDVEPFTMTSPERIESLCNSVDYLCQQGIPGDIVECGVWRGGSMMAIARSLCRHGDLERQLHLYDTYEGMPPALDVDRDFTDAAASTLLQEQEKSDPKSIWCYSAIDEVRNNMSRTSYPSERLHFVKGKVEQTLLDEVPEKIALLRLDTDWYESTKICLEKLFPRLVDGGVLIVDDYGHWRGCKKAVDEYFTRMQLPMLLHRIDYTGRIGIRTSGPESYRQKRSA